MVDTELEWGGYASYIGWIRCNQYTTCSEIGKENYTCKLKIAFHWEISRPVGLEKKVGFEKEINVYTIASMRWKTHCDIVTLATSMDAGAWKQAW